MDHLKKYCIVCGKSEKKTNKEHVFPQWLLKKTNTYYLPIKSFHDKSLRIPGKNCVIPICTECNSELANKLETPMKEIFERIEAGDGFNDKEAEIIVRWMWKITGMFIWIDHNKDYDYKESSKTLKDWVIKPISSPRERIALAICRLSDDKKVKDQSAMGIDTVPYLSRVLSIGVFSKLAIITCYARFIDDIPDNYTKYILSPTPILMNPSYKIYPKIGFRDGPQAVATSIKLSRTLTLKHDLLGVVALDANNKV